MIAGPATDPMSHSQEQDPTQPLEEIRAALDEGDDARAAALMEDCHPAEVAQLLESMPSAERDPVWGLLPPAHQGEVLAYTDDAVRAERLRQMDPAELAAATRNLDTDDAADLLQDLPEERVDQVLDAMDVQNRARLERLLVWPEDSAGGLMDVDVLTVRGDVCLEAVSRYLRRRGRIPEHTDRLIVVDRDNRFQGTLSLTDLILGAPEALVEEVMDRELEGIPADMTASEVAKLFEQRDLVSAPVVAADGELLGRITVDDVLDVIRDEGDHTVMSMAGLSEEDDMFAPVWRIARRRTLWLAVNLATAFLAAWVIGLFEATIQEVVALAVLMPVVASMGGIAGSQTLTVVIRGMALGYLGASNTRILFLKELAVGSLNGLVWAAVVAAAAGLWFANAALAGVIAAAMVLNLVVAALAGAAIPLVLRRLEIDPALAGGVILTTFTDVVGFMSFLGLGTLVLIG